MIRKSIIFLSTLALLASAVLWGWVAWYPRRGYQHYGGPGPIVGIKSFDDVYVIDVAVSENVRVGGGVAYGGFLIVYQTPLDGGTVVKHWELGGGGIVLFNSAVEDPVICAMGIMASRRGGGPVTYQHVRGVRAPCWATCALFAAYPAFAFIRGPLRRRRRRRKGSCVKCGYDLTGNVTGECPECGAGFSRVVRDWSDRFRELKHVPRESRRHLLKAGYAPVKRRWAYMVILGVTFSGLLGACWFVADVAWVYWGAPNWVGLLGFIPGPVVAFVGASTLTLRVFRRRVRRELRELLRQRGIKVCPRCGYNLAGNESGICPECGTVIERP